MSNNTLIKTSNKAKKMAVPPHDRCATNDMLNENKAANSSTYHRLQNFRSEAQGMLKYYFIPF